MNAFDIVGVETGDIVSTIATAAQGGLAIAQKEKASGEAKANVDKKVAAAIAADSKATQAIAQAATSAALAVTNPAKAGLASADKMSADSAVAAQDAAGAAVPPEGQQRRIDNAQHDLDVSQAALQATLRKGGDASYQQALVTAANQTLAKARGGGAPAKGGDKGAAAAPEGESFLSKTIVGPIKVWMAGVVVVLGGGYFLLRKKR